MEFKYDAGVVVYARRRRGRRFLFLVKEDGTLDLPKGNIEKGESAQEAAIRETKEESGLDVKLDDSFKYGIDYWYVIKKVKVKKHVAMFLARVGEGSKVRISWEHRGYKWLDYDSAMEELPFKNWKAVIAKVEEYIGKKEKMDALNRQYRKMPERSRGWSLSRRFVPGEGSLDAEVMLVGQAPGAREDKEGRPFVGISGRLLDSLIGRAGLKRSSCYITSVVQFFPPRNRVPAPDEIEVGKDFLLRQIGIVNPRIVVLLGSVAAKAVIGADNIMQRHGTIIKKGGRTYFLTLHPAAAVRLKKNIPLIEKDFEKLKTFVRIASP